jgi:acyl-CoA oxidase
MWHPKQYGGGGNIQDYFAIMETLSYHEIFSNQVWRTIWTWGMSIQPLAKKTLQYLKDIGSLKPRLFAMTETNHGSKNQRNGNNGDNHKTKHLPFIHRMKRQKRILWCNAVHGQM